MLSKILHNTTTTLLRVPEKTSCKTSCVSLIKRSEIRQVEQRVALRCWFLPGKMPFASRPESDPDEVMIGFKDSRADHSGIEAINKLAQKCEQQGRISAFSISGLIVGNASIRLSILMAKGAFVVT